MTEPLPPAVDALLDSLLLDEDATLTATLADSASAGLPPIRHAELAAVNLRRAGVADRVQIVLGAALDTLPTLSGDFDFVFIDADKENNSAYLNYAVELARPGTVIVVDNVVRDGRVLAPAPDDAQARAVREMLDMMGRHPRLDSAAIQTVGVKGWDGFAVALVR